MAARSSSATSRPPSQEPTAPSTASTCRSGQVAYAVLTFGDSRNGSSYHPLPWNQLHYDPNHGGYIVDVTKEQLEGAPTYSASEA